MNFRCIVDNFANFRTKWAMSTDSAEDSAEESSQAPTQHLPAVELETRAKLGTKMMPWAGGKGGESFRSIEWHGMTLETVSTKMM